MNDIEMRFRCLELALPIVNRTGGNKLVELATALENYVRGKAPSAPAPAPAPVTEEPEPEPEA
ncbi:hypothetical protein [Sphingomonas sp. MMS24-J13]|uniref:hypothetical protein n=1 Tax=Sphingomonas sp. MMS24-J13 TaxID=3238686 RepID=UPI00384C6BF1